MRQDHINYLVVGSTVLLMLVALLVIILKITAHHHDSERYYVTYKNVAGLKEGAAISFGGFPIGQIQHIAPIVDTSGTAFKVTLAIRADWRIPDDSIARIVSPGLFADNQIDIAEGESAQALMADDEMKGQEASTLFAALDTVANEITTLSSNNIQPLLTQLSERIENISGHFDDIGNNLSQSIPAITQNMGQLLNELNGSATQLATLFDNKNKRHIQRIFQNADAVSSNLAALSAGLDNSRQQLDQLISNANTILDSNNEDIRIVMTDIRNTINSVSQNIDTIVYNLEGSSRNVNEFSRKISANPGVLLGGQPPSDNAEAMK